MNLLTKFGSIGIFRLAIAFSVFLEVTAAVPLHAGISEVAGEWSTVTDQKLTLKPLPAKTDKGKAGTCVFTGTTASAGTFVLKEVSFGNKRNYKGTFSQTGNRLAMKFNSSQFEPVLRAWFLDVSNKKHWKIRNLNILYSSSTTQSVDCSGRPFLVTTKVTGKLKAVISGKPATKSFVFIHATSFLPAGEAPTKAIHPNPTNEELSVAVTTGLSWSGDGGTTSYDVYFGTDNPPTFVASLTTSTYYPGSLSQNQTYFWRIDSRNASGVTVGDNWSFTTRGPVVYALTVNFAGTGSGTVTDGADFTCSATSSRNFPPGTVVSLTASAAAGSAFNSWSGEYTSRLRNHCTVTMDRSRSVTVDFGKLPSGTVTIFSEYDNCLYKSSTSTGPENTIYNNSDLAVGSIWQWWPAFEYWSYDWWASALFFPISQVSGRTIKSAVLRLYPRNDPDNVVADRSIKYEVRAYSSGWNPDTVTWNTAIGLTTHAEGAQQAYPPLTATLPMEFDVTSIVRQWASEAWPNQGFKLWMYNNNYGNPNNYFGTFRALSICSREVYDGNTNRRPQLVIDYE
jgi:hypothetical protein